MRIEQFDSVESYAAQVSEKVGPQKRNTGYGGDSNHYSTPSDDHHWDGGVGYAAALERAIAGDPSLVDRYSHSVDKLVTDYKLSEQPRQAYISSIAGSRVSVPEYLAGSPRCMKRRAPQEMQTRTVNIFVSTTCSAGVSSDNMLKRGATILALLEFLQMSQVSVQLCLVAETHGRTDGDLIQVIRVQSNPLDLSTAGFAIAHPAFARKLTYAMAYVLDGFNGNWGRSHGHPKYNEILSDAIGMTTDDIFVPAPVSWDEEIMENPETWLSKRIEKIRVSHS